MSITDTIQSMEDNTKRAYDTAEAQGATLPTEKNLANLSDVITQLNKIDVVQETGDSTTAVMSQKAVTDALDSVEGSEAQLLDAYTSSPTNTQAYNAAYINDRLNNYHAVIGATRVSPTNYRNLVLIGGNTAGGGSDIYKGIAIGEHATLLHDNSIALGSNTRTTRKNELSIGSASSGDNPKTRYIANVTPGELPTDAVNLQQMQDYVAENAGSDYQLPAYVVGNTIELDPVAYTVTEDTITANVARTDTVSGTAINPALVTFPMATATHAGAMSSADKTTLENLSNNYYTKAEIDNIIGDINEAIVKLDTGTGV